MRCQQKLGGNLKPVFLQLEKTLASRGRMQLEVRSANTRTAQSLRPRQRNHHDSSSLVFSQKRYLHPHFVVYVAVEGEER